MSFIRIKISHSHGISMPRTKGLTIYMTGESHPGGHKHMEDYISIKSETEGEEQGFLGVFDGHGGKEAAEFASENLRKAIKSETGFSSDRQR